MSVDVLGSNFQPGARVKLGTGITVKSVTFVDSTDLHLDITISSTAALGPRTVKVFNPDGGKGVVLGLLPSGVVLTGGDRPRQGSIGAICRREAVADHAGGGPPRLELWAP
jgi:hypothetical protein